MKENNIIDHLIYHSTGSPQKDAFIFLENGEDQEVRLSYAELLFRVQQLASVFKANHYQGQMMILAYQDIIEFTICFLACQYAGVIAIPVFYANGNKHILKLIRLIEDADVHLISSTSNLKIKLEEVLLQRPENLSVEIFPTDAIDVTGAGNLKQCANEFKIAFIQYTSGSTGNTKGVVVTAENLIHNQQLIKETFNCTRDSVIFSWLPFHHDMGLIGNILQSIYVGCTCVLMSPFHFIQKPQRWLAAISKYKVTHSGGPNFSYDLCVDNISPEDVLQLDLSSWKVAYNGSEPIQINTIRRFTDHFKLSGFKEGSYFTCYGLAEATLLVTGVKKEIVSKTVFIDNNWNINEEVLITSEPHETSREIVSSGEVAAGMNLRIISTTDKVELDDKQSGEICISGKSVTKGYWKKENSGLFYEIDGVHYLRTGDLGFLYQNELFVCGRLKEILIIRGVNFYPYDIEQAVSQSDISIETNGVAIFSFSDAGEEFVVAAEIKRTAIKGLDTTNLIKNINDLIVSTFGISPHDIVLTPTFGIPRTTSGKLQRVKCKSYYNDGNFNVIASKLQLKEQTNQHHDIDLIPEVIRLRDYNSIKFYLIEVIKSKIGGIQDSLLNDDTELTSMGVDSLKAIELINTINRDLAINIDITSLFNENTLGGLINLIESVLWLKNEQNSGKSIII